MDDVFQQTMGISPDEYKVMLTEPPNNPKENREKLVEMMFEKFEVPRLYLGN
jgi:actin-related protein